MAGSGNCKTALLNRAGSVTEVLRSNEACSFMKNNVFISSRAIIFISYSLGPRCSGGTRRGSEGHQDRPEPGVVFVSHEPVSLLVESESARI